MADYYSLLSRAVANLPKTSPASARKAIYERARKALSNQLRSLKPPLPESDITREETALQAAISRLEAEFDPTAAAPIVETSAPPEPEPEPPSAPAPRAPPPPPPVRPAPPTPPTRPAAPPPVRPSPSPPVRPQSAAPPARPLAPTIPTPTIASSTSEPLRSAAPSVVHPSVASAFSPTPAPAVQMAAPNPTGASAAPPVQAKSPPVQSDEAAAATWENIRAAAPPLLAAASDGLAAPSPPYNPAAKILTPPATRTDSETRPSAPSPARPAGTNPWPWAAAGLVLCLVGVVAVAAFLLREKPQDLTIKEPLETPASSASPGSGSKIVERVGGSPAAAPTPAPSANPDQAQAPSPAPASPEPQPTSAPAPAAPGAATPPAAAAPAQAPAPAAAVAAARAAMLVATTQDALKPAVSLGSVVWSAVPANPGQPGSAGVKAEVDIPDLKMHATMVLRKNVDTSLPASHTIDLRLTFDDGSPIKGVKDIGVPQMRREDPPSVSALAGVRVKINDTYFLIGLNRDRFGHRA